MWVRANKLRASDVRRMREETAGFSHQPLVSLLLPLRDADSVLLHRTLASVLAQVYPYWELHILVNGFDSERTDNRLAHHRILDERIKVSSASPSAALAESRGELFGFVSENDELAPEALFEIVKLLQDHPEADLVYSDEDEIDEMGTRSNPHFKPGWSPELLLCTNYVSRLGVYRKSILEKIGEFDGLHGIALRLAEKTNNVFHIPRVLYHSRKIAESSNDDWKETSRHAIRAALERRNTAGTLEENPLSGIFAFTPEVKGDPKVSVVIPTRDNLALLRNCIENIENLSTYENYELIIVDNRSANPATLQYLASTPHRVLRFDEEFNYSRINNFAAAHSDGEFLLLLNDDTEVISARWIEAMLGHAQREEVGAVGAKLLYPNGLVQHAGIVLGVGNFWAPGVAAHACQHYPVDIGGRAGEAIHTTRNYSAVTAACMMLRKEVFDEVGGFDESLTVAFNDVDLCLRIQAHGYRIVYTPHAELYHYESSSRGPQRRPEENLLMRKRWSETLDNDPYYNPNFSLGAGDFNLRADMLRPRSLRANSTGPIAHLEEMEKEDREAFLKEQRSETRGSRRTSLVSKKKTPLLSAPPTVATAADRRRPPATGSRNVERSVREDQLVWMFGSPRTGSTWISGVMAELDNQKRWNEPHVGLLFGSFLYEKIGPENALTNSPAFILGEPHRKAWLTSIKNFVLENAAARYPGLGRDQYIVIKEPNGAIGAPLMTEAMPESRLIFLLRDPRDVVSSWLDAFGEDSWTSTNREYDTDEKLNTHTRFLSERYLKVVSQVQKAYEAHSGKKAFVRYEDLRRDTFGTMYATYQSLGIEVDEASLRTAVEKHAWESIPESRKGSGKFYRKAAPGGWREDLTPAQIRIVEEVTSSVISEFYGGEVQGGEPG